MADISKITLPNGSSYNFKDATARAGLAGKAEASHTHSSYVNQNAFSNITVGSTTVSADSATDTLTLVAGSNITITPDATNDKITIASTNTWRGIQNNLTSDSTTDSLSAAQGKVLKGLVDGKAASSHTHSEYAAKSKYGNNTINVGRKSGTTVGNYSAAEGYNTTASGYQSHAEGNETTASGNGSHAEGSTTTASGNYSHAEGGGTTASGFCSHAGGHYTKALHDYEVAHGRYNISSSDTLFSVGDGTADDARHNAFEITTSGGKLHDKDIAVKDDIPTISELVYTIRFSEITWNISGYGKYYYTINIPASTQLISVNLGYWEGMYLDEFVQVTMNDQTNIQLISNTAKETGLLAVRISYI